MDLEALTPVHYLAGDRCEMADERIVRDVLRSKDSQVMGYLSGPFLRDGWRSCYANFTPGDVTIALWCCTLHVQEEEAGASRF
mmetsp:Transcript_30649/g.97869  ORF Transcript_30649/g.97869 Transcript_30649/m.97869 type:complete len:83 (-) Transcript_30649:215-463(-)